MRQMLSLNVGGYAQVRVGFPDPPPNNPLNLCMESPWGPDCQLSWGWLPWRLLRVLEPAVGKPTEALSGLQEYQLPSLSRSTPRLY